MRVIQLYNSHQLLRRTYKWRGGLLLLRGALAVCATSMDGVITTSTTPTSTPQKKGARGGGAQVTPKKSPARPAAPAPVTPALQRKAARISAQLDALYGSPPVPLTHGSAFQLLVAVVLSAQTTDKKVNEVTPELFGLAPDAHALAQMDVASIQSIIAPIGLAPTKARNLSGMAKLLLERHGGEVPSTFEELEALPGVGHKTASVVMSQAFGHPAFPVDTHIHRLAARWGLSSGKSVEQTEADLKVLLPQHTWRDAHLQIIYFGREHCPAKRHDAAACPICSWAGVGGSGDDDGGEDSGELSAVPKKRGGKRGGAGAATPTVVAAAAAAITLLPSDGGAVQQRQKRARGSSKAP